MRSTDTVLKPVVKALTASRLGRQLITGELKTFCAVEIGLLLQREVMGDGNAAVEAWALFSGYPFARAWGAVTSAEGQQKLRVARHTLWIFRRREAWRDALEVYQSRDRHHRGFDVPDPDQPAHLLSPRIASERWQCYARVLAAAPPFHGAPLPLAGPGRYRFTVGRDRTSVTLPSLPLAALPDGHDVRPTRPYGASLPPISWADLEQTAREMDDRDFRKWEERLHGIRLFTRTATGFARSDDLTIDRILHLLGIVSVGKSTLRDVLSVHLATKLDRRVTVVVGDVAELLRLVRTYNDHTRTADFPDGMAAPVIGVSSREQHAQRLHRRHAGRTSPGILAHNDPAFAYLSTACPVDALRREQDGDPDVLPYNDAPCDRLDAKGKRHTCVFWSACPRHHGDRRLVDAAIWVATPQSLVNSSVPWPQSAERIRYLELACRRSDLVIIDEADRVQVQLDHLFAPAVPLEGTANGDSMLTETNRRKLTELANGRQVQLSSSDVENWSAAVNTVTAATNRLYAMLATEMGIRDWLRGRYFNSWTLQLRLVDDQYPPPSGEGPDPNAAARKELRDVLDEFRDNPFGDRTPPSGEHQRLVELLGDLLHTAYPARTRKRLAARLEKLFHLGAGAVPDKLARQFEFTLLLAALEPKLALMNAMWPRVAPILRLGFNQMYTIPRDYAPMVPESPMGNVLGFQFVMDGGPDEGGPRSGELRYFRCCGLGRELLRTMPGLPELDGLPGTNVLLMSGSSWAGLSSRYHIPIPVGAVLKPAPGVTNAIGEKSKFRFEPIRLGNRALTVSGTKQERKPDILRRIAECLGTAELDELSALGRELGQLDEDRKNILLLVGSYAEATLVADTLHETREWRDRVIRLAADNDDLDSQLGGADGDEHHARVLRRGDVDNLVNTPGQILVAPLLAMERGHNVLNKRSHAAIGSIYFLVRPNPRPDDLSLAVFAINDWMTRALHEEGDAFGAHVRNGTTLDEGARCVRDAARRNWYRFLSRSLAWGRLGDDRNAVTWDMLVLIWQVIGRAVRGGVPARVTFVDAAFAPNAAVGSDKPDSPDSSLLHSMRAVLQPYFTSAPGQQVCQPHDREVVQDLFGPFWTALSECLNEMTKGNNPCRIH
ncbi:MAG TPA: hypothetical protein VGL93_12360 [Streptosporangiaceae bacterium]